MNYVAHALVAAEAHPDASDAFIFGAMAPDLVGMAGTKLVRGGEHADLAAGVEFHIATDRTFDANPLFTAIKSQFRPLHEAYLASGGARICADAGTEMLLDGFVLQRTHAAETYGRVMEAAAKGAFPVGQVAVQSEALVELVRRVRPIGVPYFYQDPLVVAQRLQRRVQNYGRLRFDERFVGQVAGTFVQQQAAIAKVANALVGQTAARLADNHEIRDTGPVFPLLPRLAVAATEQQAGQSAFAAGRSAARSALQQAGVREFAPLPRSPRGEPLFPDGFTGSISHTGDWAVAAVAPKDEYVSVGIDIEAAGRVFRRGIAKRVTNNAELEQFSEFGEQGPLVIASLKEAVYKAIHYAVQRRVGFHEVELERLTPETARVHMVSPDLQHSFPQDIAVTTHCNNDGFWQSSLCLVEA